MIRLATRSGLVFVLLTLLLSSSAYPQGAARALQRLRRLVIRPLPARTYPLAPRSQLTREGFERSVYSAFEGRPPYTVERLIGISEPTEGAFGLAERVQVRVDGELLSLQEAIRRSIVDIEASGHGLANRWGRPIEVVVNDLVEYDPARLLVYQGILKQQGLYDGVVDGLPGPLTREAIARFRQLEGLPDKGVLDHATQRALDRRVAARLPDPAEGATFVYASPGSAEGTIRLQVGGLAFEMPEDGLVDPRADRLVHAGVAAAFRSLDRPGARIVGIDSPDLLSVLRRAGGGRADYYVAHDLHRARERLESLPMVRGPADIAAVIPGGDFQGVDYQVFQRIRDPLERAGIRVLGASQRVERANIVFVSFHKDENAIAYVEDLGRRGILNRRYLVLLSCYQPGDEAVVSRLIHRYGARGVFYVRETINPQAVEDVLVELADGARDLGQRPGSAAFIHRLIYDAVERAAAGARPGFRPEVEKVGEGFPQISHGGARSPVEGSRLAA